MKFGKHFRYQQEETLPTWSRDNYLDYKALKRLIRRLPPPADVPPAPLPAPAAAEGEEVDGQVVGRGNVVQGDCFTRLLDMELQKLNDFYLEWEEDYVIRLQVLKERIERVQAKKNDAISEYIEQVFQIREGLMVLHGELVLLQTYCSVNFVALVKILKKYDKRTGGVLSQPFTQRAQDQPVFTTQFLTRVIRVCEANLELLSRIEADPPVLQ